LVLSDIFKLKHFSIESAKYHLAESRSQLWRHNCTGKCKRKWSFSFISEKYL